jgi:hypothetical protein
MEPINVSKDMPELRPVAGSSFWMLDLELVGLEYLPLCIGDLNLPALLLQGAGFGFSDRNGRADSHRHHRLTRWRTGPPGTKPCMERKVK